MSVWLQIVIGWVVGAPLIAVLVGKVIAGADRALVRPAMAVAHRAAADSANARQPTGLTDADPGFDPAQLLVTGASGAAA